MSIRNLIPARRWLIRLGVFVGIGIGFCVGMSAHLDWRARQDWAEACAEADRLDPGWRWDDMVAAHPAIPAGHNSAEFVVAAAQLLPKSSSRDAKFDNELQRALPQHRLSPTVVADIAAALADNPASVEIARLADCPAGHIPLPTRYLLGTDFPIPFDYHNVTKRLLFPRLALLADQGDADAALDQVRVILYASRPPAEFPTEIDNLVAGAVRVHAARGVERVLAQGEPSFAAIDAARRQLEAEAGRRMLLPAFRGHRAWIAEIIRALDDGRLERDEVAQSGMFADPHDWTHWPWADRWLGRLTGADLRRSNAVALLRCYTQMVEWLKESPDGFKIHQAEWAELYAKMRQGAAFLLAFHPRLVADERFAEAQFRCAAVALAAEQFRRETGHWPAALDDVVPKYLSVVPRDPCDLKPLRLARRPDGIVIYSVGLDGTDEGGAIATDDAAKPTDIGIRLWDVAQRRQPPLPSKVVPTRPAAAAQPPG